MPQCGFSHLGDTIGRRTVPAPPAPLFVPLVGAVAKPQVMTRVDE
jgi:hypothetical protein